MTKSHCPNILNGSSMKRKCVKMYISQQKIATFFKNTSLWLLLWKFKLTNNKFCKCQFRSWFFMVSFLKISISMFISFEPDDYSSPVEILKRSFWRFLKVNSGTKDKNTLETLDLWEFGKNFNRDKILGCKAMQSPMDLVKKSKYHLYLIEGRILYTATKPTKWISKWKGQGILKSIAGHHGWPTKNIFEFQTL